MTDEPYFQEEALSKDARLRDMTREKVMHLLRPIVTQFRSDSEHGTYSYSSPFPRGVCGEAREHLMPLLRAQGCNVVCRVFESTIGGFHRVATVGDIITDPIKDADGPVNEKVYVGPQNPSYREIVSATQFEEIAKRYWRCDGIVYFRNQGFMLDRGLELVPIPGQVPDNLIDALIAHCSEKMKKKAVLRFSSPRG